MVIKLKEKQLTEEIVNKHRTDKKEIKITKQTNPLTKDISKISGEN